MSAAAESPRRFLLWLGAGVGLALLLTAAINLIVDPYGIYRLVSRPGFNQNKPTQQFHHRLLRAHEIARVKPDAVLMGTSRTQVGLDPRSPAFAGKAERVLNIALSDGTPYEALRYLEHADAEGKVKLAVMGLDFLSFDLRTKPNDEFLEDRLAVSPTLRSNWLASATDWIPTLLSIDALQASQRTVRRQGEPSYFFEGGLRRPNTMEDRIAQEGGMRGAILFSERDYLKSYACFRFETPSGLSRTLSDFRNLVGFARQRGIALVLFTSPSHVRSQLVLRASGLWPEYERWKRALVKLLEAEGEGASGPFPLWEFGGADPRYTAETVPPATDSKTLMRWYFESSHYRPELGEVVLRRLLGYPDTEQTQGFGVPLRQANVERELARVSAEVDGYVAAHPDEWKEIEALARELSATERAGHSLRVEVDAPAGSRLQGCP